MSLKERQDYCVKIIKELRAELNRVPTSADFKNKLPRINVTELFGSHDGLLRAAGLLEAIEEFEGPQPRQPRILVLDLELKPIIAYVWGLFDQNIGLDQIIQDWSIMSWAAKWIGESNVMYEDVSGEGDYSNDERIVRLMWHKLDEADVIITQNGKKFDEKKLNTKFEKYKLGRPSPYRHIDTLKIKKKHFGLTSNKLAYSTDYFNETYKKLDHGKFAGMKLWIECLNRNPEAWAEMKEYNIYDVLSLEELYLNSLRHWDDTINFGTYTQKAGCCPNCGSEDLFEDKFNYSKTGAFQTYRCKNCGTISQSKINEIHQNTRKAFLK
ncbi:MAG TPA: ribonuclease H-like domain-containing protein [Nitrosomonas sp.]|nr:ribonuclease H-like domain-containing protein [Nitrosomonas sp.]